MELACAASREQNHQLSAIPSSHATRALLVLSAIVVLAAMALRPVLVVQPSMDRDATPAVVRAAVEQARKAYAAQGSADKLALDEPHDYQRLPTATQTRASEGMTKNLSKP
jgi:hypothetical protein